MRKFILFAALIVAASATSINPFATSGAAIVAPKGVIPGVTECEGSGTLLELRSTGCNDDGCILLPGTTYSFEAEFVASADASGLNLDVVVFNALQIISTDLENSAIVAGERYTISFTLVPNDMLAGQDIPVTLKISHVDLSVVEFCANFIITIE